MTPSKNANPLVSICIPAFNSEKTIEKTIGSIIQQTYKNIEIIVVDNCSTDATIRIVESFDDPRIKIIRNTLHLPVAEYNWNRCFQYVQGDYMAIFHADDVYSSFIVEEEINTFKKLKSIGAVFTLGHIINENDEITGAFRLPPGIVGSASYSYREILPKVLEYGDFLPCPTAMIPASIYRRLAPFRYEQFGSASDFDMWLRVSEYAPIVILEEKLIRYRVSKSQGTYTINRLRTDESDYLRVMDFHLANLEKSIEISPQALDTYQLFRLEDILYRAKNHLIKGDPRGFKSLIKSCSWRSHIRVVLLHPFLSKKIYSACFNLLLVGIFFSFSRKYPSKHLS